MGGLFNDEDKLNYHAISMGKDADIVHFSNIVNHVIVTGFYFV